MAKEEKKKINVKQEQKKDKLIVILSIIVVILSIVIIALKLAMRHNLDTESDLVVELHNYFNSEDLNNCDGLFTYASDVVNYDSIEDATKLCLAYQKSEIKDSENGTMKATKKKETCTEDGITFRVDEGTSSCSYTKIKSSVIDNTYKKLYGKENDNTEPFKIDNLNICYLKDGYYYCGLSETFTYTLGNESLIYRMMSKAVEKGSNIEIYDYFVKLNNYTCFKNYTTSTVNSECTTEFKNYEEIDYKFMKNYGTQYKHTYKLAEDGTYYWVQSEPINE